MSRTTQINIVLDVGYDVDPCNSIMVQHGGIFLRFSTFPSFIENEDVLKSNELNATSHFQTETERVRCTLNTV